MVISEIDQRFVKYLNLCLIIELFLLQHLLLTFLSTNCSSAPNVQVYVKG